ncbi:hypothetical protein ACH4ZX_19435 [Streptomyces sp. NPDC020490]|uniref:hypothetical protein n=1 Tax=Streptomyces sp. NPDC020490 TaxID=3365078 RepID=UPI0037980EDA
MLRGTTARAARAAIALLAAVLLALPFSFTPASPFASAHTGRQAEVKARPGKEPSGKSLRDEDVTFRHCARHDGPGVPLRTRDRHRAAAAAPECPERPLPVQDPAGPAEPAAPRAPLTSRPTTAHSSATLQVFRC